MKKFGSIAASLLALPFLVGAQVTTQVHDLNGIIRFINNILNVALPLIIAAAVVWFVWSMFQVFLAGDDDKQAKAKTNALWGIVAIFVMISVWGLVNILVRTFGLENSAPQNITNPLQQVPGSSVLPR
jgi:hypothetical protein